MNKWIQAALPMVLGAGLAATGIGAPLAAAMVGGGAALRARKVDDASGGNALMTGLSAGMGAYGGANLMGGLQSLGATPTAGSPGAFSATEAGARPAMVSTGSSTPSGLAGFGGEPPMPTPTYDFAAVPQQTPWASIERGFGQTLTSPQQSIAQMGGWKSVGMNAAMAGAPIAEAAMRPEMPRPIEAPKGTMYNYEYDPGTQEFLPTDSSAEQRYFRPQYNLMSTRTAAGGGIMQLADGGATDGSLRGYGQAPQVQGNNSNPFSATPTLRSPFVPAAPSTIGGVDYDPITQTYSGVGSSAPAASAPAYAGMFAGLAKVLGTPQRAATNQYSYDPNTQTYSNLAGGGPVAQMSERAQPYIDRAAEGAPSYAGGGLSDLGHYSDGGRMLRGPGDGVSDSIPASIEGKRPARLADNEFVVPARIVSELGNGSSEAGARQLYAMMDRVQKRRAKTTGKNKVAVDSKAYRELPA